MYTLGREQSFQAIAEAGYELVELSAGPPHLDLSELSHAEMASLGSELERHHLRCVSINPIELNPISSNAELANATYRQYRSAIELAAELGAASVVMITGRRSPLIPMPEAQAKDLLRAHLHRLLPVAAKLGVTLTLEPVPYGFLQTASEVSSFIEEFEFDGLGITVDCANSFFAGADPADELRANAALVKLVHISDSWRERWAHVQIGRGEIDFRAVADALREIGYAGPTVYELVDGEDPAARFQTDRVPLLGWGWR